MKTRHSFLSQVLAPSFAVLVSTAVSKGKRMYLLLWIPVGLIVGWLAGKSLEGNGYGRSVDIIMGAGGALVGSLAMRFAGFAGYGGVVFTTVAVIGCAALFTIVMAMVNGRTVYSRIL
jgi:uncharacterized membrane protein YeaQ/YmgE (transglycosylase-associated protein family)